MTCSRRSERGLTLVEMLVVLAILVALATVAVNSTEGVVDQGRYDATGNTLDGVRDAVLGREGLKGPDDRPFITGFVADMGRLPVVPATDPGPGLRLIELWSAPGAPAFTIAAPAGDADVRVPAGWRGPYLRLALGQDTLVDGWGNALLETDASTGAVVTTPGAAIAGVRTLGADGATGGSTYDADAELVFVRSSPAVPAKHEGLLPVRVTAVSPSSGDYVVVRVYGPVNGVVKTIAQMDVSVSDETPTALMSPFTVSIGPRVLRAYQTSSVPSDHEATISASHVSAVIPIFMVAGGLPELEIELQ